MRRSCSQKYYKKIKRVNILYIYKYILDNNYNILHIIYFRYFRNYTFNNDVMLMCFLSRQQETYEISLEDENCCTDVARAGFEYQFHVKICEDFQNGGLQMPIEIGC